MSLSSCNSRSKGCCSRSSRNCNSWNRR